MDKIEINEYVRTNTGYILKYSEEHEKDYVDNFLSCPYIMPERIVKHSKNLIDLIEPGDVVEVLDIDWVRIFNIDNEDILEDFKEEIAEKNWKLLAILTKEMYEQNCYVVEE